MTDQTTPQDATRPTTAPKSGKTDEPAGGGGGVMGVLFVVFAIAVIVGLYALARLRTDPPGPKELPLASILVEYDAMDQDARLRVDDIESKLSQTLDCFGPCEQKYLVPGASPGVLPTVRTLKQISQEDWDKAWPYFTGGDWLVPRVFGIDGKTCVIRVAPRNGERQFPPGSGELIASTVKEALNNHGLKGARIYSSALGLGGQAERDALNVTFGASTAWVKISRGPQAKQNNIGWLSVDGQKLLEKIKPGFAPNSHIRSVVTPVSWLKYFESVRGVKPTDVKVPAELPVIQQAFTFGQVNQVIPHLDQGGDVALVAVTTDLEGTQNLELYYYMASVLQEELHADVFGPTWKLPRGPAPAATK